MPFLPLLVGTNEVSRGTPLLHKVHKGSYIYEVRTTI